MYVSTTDFQKVSVPRTSAEGQFANDNSNKENVTYGMNPIRSRMEKINLKKITEAIMKYEHINNNNNNIVSQTHDIWNIVVQDFVNELRSLG